MPEPDPVEEARHELADLEAALAEGGLDAESAARLDELRALVVAEQNPVGAAVGEDAEEVTAEAAEEFRPEPADLVVTGADDDAILQVLDKHDEDQIIREFQKRALTAMLYDFQKSGSRVVDLSYQGVNEAIRLLNGTGKVRIGIDKSVKETRREIIEGIEYWAVTVYAVDQVTGYGQFGIAREPLFMEIRESTARGRKTDGKPVREDVREGVTVFSIFDVFSETKALNKAQRNALKVMIPERMRQTMIAMKRGDAGALKVIEHGAGAAAIAELPPPVVTERARELETAIKATYDEIREVNVLALLPGQFDAKLARARSSEEALAAMLEGLRGMLATERGSAAS